MLLDLGEQLVDVERTMRTSVCRMVRGSRGGADGPGRGIIWKSPVGVPSGPRPVVVGEENARDRSPVGDQWSFRTNARRAMIYAVLPGARCNLVRVIECDCD
jgi:hypothetical protein